MYNVYINLDERNVSKYYSTIIAAALPVGFTNNVAPPNQIKPQIKAIQDRKATIHNLITKSHVRF